MTTQSRLQSRQQRKTLFAQGRQIATNTAKSLCARQTAEAARHLLLHFDHAKIPLGQIVVKIHAQVFQEAEESLLVFAQTIEQVAGGTLFGASSFPRGSKSSWMGLIPLIEDGHKLGFPIDDLQPIQVTCPPLSCLLSRFLHIQQQGFEIGGPCCCLPRP